MWYAVTMSATGFVPIRATYDLGYNGLCPLAFIRDEQIDIWYTKDTNE